MNFIEIRDSLVIVEGRPHSASEVLISGTVSGFINANKNSGFRGKLSLIDPKIIYEPSGILIIGEPLHLVDHKLILSEERRGFTLKALGKLHTGLHEVGIKLENVITSLALFFNPRKLVLRASNADVQVKEGFALIEIAVKPREQVAEARVGRV